jgi:hypothetical protein
VFFAQDVEGTLDLSSPERLLAVPVRGGRFSGSFRGAVPLMDILVGVMYRS